MREDKPKGTFLIDIKIPSYIIFDYIIGRSPQHPFDLLLDIHEEERFECQQTFIYDHKTGAKVVQSLEYLTFFIELDKCKKILFRKGNPKRSEVNRLAEELSEIVPEKLLLPTDNFNSQTKKTNHEKLQKIFGIKDFKSLKFSDAKITEEDVLLKEYRQQQLKIYKGLM
jgi:hypothetical protein